MKAINVLVAVLVLSIPLATVAAEGGGSEGGGGGHSIVLPDESATLLDLVENPEEAVVDRVVIVENSETREAAQEALRRIELLRPLRPAYVEALIKKIFGEMTWHLSNVPLVPIEDFDLGVPTGLMPPQVARQTAKGEVLIDRNLFSKMTPQARSALFVHEGLLALYRLHMPRPLIRGLVRVLFDDSKRSEVQHALAKQMLESMDAKDLQNSRYTISLRSLGGIDAFSVSVDSKKTERRHGFDFTVSGNAKKEGSHVVIWVEGLPGAKYLLTLETGYTTDNFSAKYTLAGSLQKVEFDILP